jgi:hypothetical protein
MMSFTAPFSGRPARPLGPGLAIVVGVIAVTTGTRAAIRTEADTATAPNDPGLP